MKQFATLTWCMLCISLVIIMCGCTQDSIDYSAQLDYNLTQALNHKITNGIDFYTLPEETDYKNIPQDEKNRLSKDKVELGKFLFFETGLGMDSKHLSSQGTYSCASCHIPEKGFRPDNVQGIADGGMGYADHREMNLEYSENDLDVQEARPLSLINVAFVKNTGWNGQFGAKGANLGTEDVWSERLDTKRNSLGYEALETQNFQGMRTHRMIIDSVLLIRLGYMDMFDKAFPEYGPNNRYSLITGSLAISAYLRTVLANRAPFQEWLRGDSNAMSVDEKKGALLFFGKANCSNCHYGPNLGSVEFHALGVNDMDQHPLSVKADNPIARRNLGRGGFTLKEEDNYKFKVPGIYNMDDADHFFHGSSVQTLEDLIDYKNTATKENERVTDAHMSRKFVPLGLSNEEKAELISFIRKSLKDPDLERYQPDFVMSGNCIPNNDEVSQEYLNCDN